MAPLLPTAFLPPLPRAQHSLGALRTPDLLAHIAVLKALYVPPIHGGFTVEEVTTTTTGAGGDGLLGLGAGGGREGGGSGLGLEGLALDGLDEGADGDEEGDDELGLEADDAGAAHLDAFEKEWAEKWLNGVVRRAQAVIEADDAVSEMEGLQREATAVLAMMAGTSAAGSVTRHLLFPVAPYLAAAAIAPSIPISADLSPETTTFLRSLQHSPELSTARLGAAPASPVAPASAAAGPSASPRARRASSASASAPALSPTRTRRQRARGPAAVPVLLHDAPMGDHLGVGMQTWGSAILLGREMALRPADFGLVSGGAHPAPGSGPSGASRGPPGPRVLELGAGTGLLSILCRKLLDLHAATLAGCEPPAQPPRPYGHVLATDFLPNVLANLQTCVDLNFHAGSGGIDVAKLDWTTFVPFMEARAGRAGGPSPGEARAGEDAGGGDEAQVGEEEVVKHDAGAGWDLVLASDCVYDDTHAGLLRQVGGWVVRLPDPAVPSDAGGTFHILSPLRPTFAPELASIDTHFPTLASYPPLAERQAAARAGGGPGAADEAMRGEGRGAARGLKLGVRGQGKRSVQGRKGEGRVDEVVGYWWWEVGWG